MNPGPEDEEADAERWSAVTAFVTMKDVRIGAPHGRSGAVRFRLRRSIPTRKVRSGIFPVYALISRLEQSFFLFSVIPPNVFSFSYRTLR